VLALLALLLVEASDIPASGSFIVGADVYMRVAGYSWKSDEYGLTEDSHGIPPGISPTIDGAVLTVPGSQYLVSSHVRSWSLSLEDAGVGVLRAAAKSTTARVFGCPATGTGSAYQ
jgi:hypothetical protein